MSNINNCQPCAPVPTQPLAPPPVCPATVECDEYVQSDCVISTVATICTTVYVDPAGDAPDETVGLIISEGTTLTDVYQQLTSTACIFNPSVLGAVLQTIGDPTHPNYNQTLNDIFCQIVCACSCDEECAGVVSVSIATYLNVTTVGFDITFLAQPDYNYQITINDSNATPFTTYTWSSTTPPNNGNAPISYTINTSQFIRTVASNPPVITTPPPDMELAPGHSYEVYINAINPQNASCPAGPWTVVTQPSLDCGDDCATVQITVAGDGTNINNFAIDVTYQTGPVFPIAYMINIYDDQSQPLTPLNAYYSIPNAPAIPDPNTGLYPQTVTNYEWQLLTAGGTYTVQVTPVCSIDPILCLGDTVEVEIIFLGPTLCVAPDIINVAVIS